MQKQIANVEVKVLLFEQIQKSNQEHSRVVIQSEADDLAKPTEPEAAEVVEDMFTELRKELEQPAEEAIVKRDILDMIE